MLKDDSVNVRLAAFNGLVEGGKVSGNENARTLDLMVPLMIELDGRHQGEARTSWKFLG